MEITVRRMTIRILVTVVVIDRFGAFWVVFSDRAFEFGT